MLRSTHCSYKYAKCADKPSVGGGRLPSVPEANYGSGAGSDGGHCRLGDGQVRPVGIWRENPKVDLSCFKTWIRN